LTEVTYYVALQFVASDDGIAAGERLNPNAVARAVNCQSNDYCDPFPSLPPVGYLWRMDFPKPPRQRRILSALSADRQRIRST
jgi:hypothetical protein